MNTTICPNICIIRFWKLILFYLFQFLFQLDSEGSRSGSSLSLRAMAPGVGGQTGGQPAPSPAHSGNTGSGHRGVQRSISATSGNKPRRGSTGAENSTTCELTGGPGSIAQAGGTLGTAGGDTGGNTGQGWTKFRPLFSVCSLCFNWFDSIIIINQLLHLRSYYQTLICVV